MGEVAEALVFLIFIQVMQYRQLLEHLEAEEGHKLYQELEMEH